MPLQDRARAAETVSASPALPWTRRLVRNAPWCVRRALLDGSIALAVSALGLGALVVTALLVFRFVDPPMSTLMLGQWLSGQSIARRWVPLEQISPHLIRAVITSEDGQFCSHRGIDFRELELALRKAEREGLDQVRGASTISMQVAKNLFLWPAKDLLRKGLELGITVPMEMLWSKQRILEVYLNIAEWGPGIFGAEAAARHHFRKPAARLSEHEAALLAAALPNPIERVARAPGPGMRRLARSIEIRARTGAGRAACVLARASTP